jgi:hypothetical protein
MLFSPIPGRLEFLAASGGIGGRDDQAIAVGANVEFGIRVDLEQFENRAIDNQCEAISVAGELLVITSPYIQCIASISDQGMPIGIRLEFPFSTSL